MFPKFQSAATVATVLLFLVKMNPATSRSVDPSNLDIDMSEVPARYIYEIDEVPDELTEINKSNTIKQGYLNSSLMFDMPIAVAIFAAVMILICCFCCLRCAVTYDGIKRSGFPGGPKQPNVVEVVKRIN